MQLAVETAWGTFGSVWALEGLAALLYPAGGPPCERSSEARVKQLEQELDEYLTGGRRDFETPLAPVGTSFQRRVWAEVQRIPYGQTRTYSQVAAASGSPTAVRAVGGANGANPVPILIPCHRLVGTDGCLRGYGGGLDMKRRLLELETFALSA
ncbi:MAG: methylated-DNA--[protein]-cysteine S-methyltransferase [Candidatus Dormibacteraeota bacterium]|uniref:Methylated-DNA--protein-cysteine methyltransferase n=1 Tax=Candidatus Dormiibacter inghamiae TaxID=3127013 RepID=A0A934NBR9_9BACT|nr:methylated-DNA--[protein]-cysteine S-methyltransferase [Candidatus Dormibacteraeota bacterium]MBJ7606623.1 methylated-DNA--[protein]-cysteine S-methyltransferase [Candidatus Dormibacteraeota bacterium]